jgi:uncharacterized protein (TIGR02186 family)
VTGRGARRWLAVAALVALTGARAPAPRPILVPDVSQHEVILRQGFTGADLLLYGAILTPEGHRAGADYDIVVVLEGPTSPMVLREKRKVAGMWVNAQSTTLRSVPGYYAVASTRPIDKIVDERTAAIYELGLGSLQLSPGETVDPAVQKRFAAGLADLMERKGLYGQNQNGVTITDQVLYRARIALPSSVQPGTYTAETFAISQGRVLTSAVARVEVKKEGFEKAVADYARHQAFSYGLLAVSVSVLMGWGAGRLFARR